MPSYDDFNFQKKTCYGLISKLPEDRPLVLRALRCAEKWHAWQTRIYLKKTPFTIHLYGVLNILIKEFKVTDPDALSAAALHDTLEDCGIGYPKLKKMFGKNVANMVRTDSQNFFASRKIYLEHFMHEPRNVQLLKVADRMDNVHSGYFKLRWPDEKMVQYLIETENYILPLSKKVSRPAHRKLKKMIDGLKQKSKFKRLYMKMRADTRNRYEDTEPHKST